MVPTDWRFEWRDNFNNFSEGMTKSFKQMQTFLNWCHSCSNGCTFLRRMAQAFQMDRWFLWMDDQTATMDANSFFLNGCTGHSNNWAFLRTDDTAIRTDWLCFLMDHIRCKAVQTVAHFYWTDEMACEQISIQKQKTISVRFHVGGHISSKKTARQKRKRTS